MEIPYDSLAPETLRRLLEEFVLREGTDYGEVESVLEKKVEDVRAQLRAGTAVITFDAETESCSVQECERNTKAAAQP